MDSIRIKREIIRWSTSAKDDTMDRIRIKRGMIRWYTSNTMDGIRIKREMGRFSPTSHLVKHLNNGWPPKYGGPAPVD
jgi:hypothetical protein